MDGLAKRSSRRSLFGSGRAPETDEWLKGLFLFRKTYNLFLLIFRVGKQKYGRKS